MSKKITNEFSKLYYRKWSEWYYLRIPNVIYIQNGKKLAHKVYDLKKYEDSEGWFYFESNDYDGIHWNAEYRIRDFYLHNGIYIHTSYNTRSLNDRGYYGALGVSVIDKKGIFPLDLIRTKVLDFNLDDDMVAELCKYRVANNLVRSEYKNCILNTKGFIPNDRSFVLNICQPVYFIGKSFIGFTDKLDFNQRGVAVAFFDVRKYFNSVWEKNENLYLDFLANGVIGDYLNSWNTSVIWATESAMNTFLSSDCDLPRIKTYEVKGEWYESFPIPISNVLPDVEIVLKYTPLPIRQDENNIMFKTIQELLPYHINGGWIPFDLKEREEMYSDTYHKLKRYIDYLKTKDKPIQ